MQKLFKIGMLITVLFVLTACDFSQSEEPTKEYTLYYLNGEMTELVAKPWETVIADDNTKELAESMLKDLHKGEGATAKSPLGDELEINDIQVKETQSQLSIYFSAAYNGKTGTDEILSRAAIVRTLCQIPGIDYVDFYVEDQPLMLAGNSVGLMSEESFVSALEEKSDSLRKKVTLYFSNKEGDALVANSTTVNYNATTLLASTIVEELIKGEETIARLQKQDELLPTLPSDVVVNSVTIRDQICYVDFSDEINTMLPEINSSIVVYSIVNSLCELPDVNRVQFTVEGQPQEYYGEMEGFHQVLERQLDLVESSGQ